jgi:hypothetical protein
MEYHHFYQRQLIVGFGRCDIRVVDTSISAWQHTERIKMTIEEAKVYLLQHQPSYWRRVIISSLIGIFIGVVGFQAFLIANEKPPVLDDRAPQLTRYGNYVGIVIDRTRTSYCSVHPNRIIFTTDTIDGATVPVVYPIPTIDFIWPHLGRVKLVVLVNIPRDLPAGHWQIQSIAYDDCHWYSGLFGNSLIVSKPIDLDLKGSTP